MNSFFFWISFFMAVGFFAGQMFPVPVGIWEVLIVLAAINAIFYGVKKWGLSTRRVSGA